MAAQAERSGGEDRMKTARNGKRSKMRELCVVFEGTGLHMTGQHSCIQTHHVQKILRALGHLLNVTSTI